MLHIELPRHASTGVTFWKSARPTTPGIYWFYGFPWGIERRTPGVTPSGPDLMCVNVVSISNGVLYVTEGFTLEGDAIGFWTPCQLPAKPSKDNTLQEMKQS